MSPRTTARRLDLKKDERLLVEFADGVTCRFSLETLRKRCPCASCKTQREQQAARPRGLTVLPAGFVSGPPTARGAQLVGNYAIQIEWTDGHGTGIYSFDFLREIADETGPAGG